MVLLHDFTLESQLGIQFWLIILSQVIYSPHKQIVVIVQVSLNAVRVVPLPSIVFFFHGLRMKDTTNSTSRIETTFAAIKKQ